MNILHAWVGTPAATALARTLLHSLWEGAAVALLLTFALRLLRSAQARYLAACLALVCIAAAFGFTFARELPQGMPHDSVQASAGPIPAAPAELGSDALAAPDSTGFLPWLAPFWMAGVLAFQLRGVAAWIGARRLRGTGVCAPPQEWRMRLDRLLDRARISQPVALLESCLSDVPVVIGYLRPVILLPVGLFAGLPPAQVEAILLHELAHIRRHDYLVNLVQMFLEGLLFYHPAIWWISAAIRAERENCCDDMVVAIQGDAYGYASALAALEERRAATDAVLASTGGNLVKRIRRLLAQPERPRAALTPIVFSCMLSLTLAGIMAAWPTRAQEVPRTPASVPETHTAASDRFARLPQPPLQLAQVQPPARPQTPDETRTSKKLADPYRKWLNEDVAYIITDEERAAFKALPTNAELEQFIADFWKRRDPTPGTPENEFKEEHYRRIAYTNEHFATPRGLPGWKTDQGRIYITFGPPDEIDAHPNGGAYQRPQEEGGGTTTTYPFEQWRYRYIEGIGNNIIIEFVDRDRTGDFRMTSDPSEKDALAGAQAKAGATVNVVGNNGVQISVPLDRYGDRPVTVSARIVASDGRVVKTFENSVRGQMAFTQFLALTPGSYTLHVAVKDPAASSAAADSISFEVK